MQQRARLRFAQIEAEALLVARIDLPMRVDAIGFPGAQRIAFRRLDLDHFCAEIAEDLVSRLPAKSRDRSMMQP
jgi:hypothetical protein